MPLCKARLESKAWIRARARAHPNEGNVVCLALELEFVRMLRVLRSDRPSGSSQSWMRFPSQGRMRPKLRIRNWRALLGPISAQSCRTAGGRAVAACTLQRTLAFPPPREQTRGRRALNMKY